MSFKRPNAITVVRQAPSTTMKITMAAKSSHSSLTTSLRPPPPPSTTETTNGAPSSMNINSNANSNNHHHHDPNNNDKISKNTINRTDNYHKNNNKNTDNDDNDRYTNDIVNKFKGKSVFLIGKFIEIKQDQFAELWPTIIPNASVQRHRPTYNTDYCITGENEIHYRYTAAFARLQKLGIPKVPFSKIRDFVMSHFNQQQEQQEEQSPQQRKSKSRHEEAHDEREEEEDHDNNDDDDDDEDNFGEITIDMGNDSEQENAMEDEEQEQTSLKTTLENQTETAVQDNNNDSVVLNVAVVETTETDEDMEEFMFTNGGDGDNDEQSEHDHDDTAQRKSPVQDNEERSNDAVRHIEKSGAEQNTQPVTPLEQQNGVKTNEKKYQPILSTVHEEDEEDDFLCEIEGDQESEETEETPSVEDKREISPMDLSPITPEEDERDHCEVSLVFSSEDEANSDSEHNENHVVEKDVGHSGRNNSSIVTSEQSTMKIIKASSSDNQSEIQSSDKNSPVNGKRRSKRKMDHVDDRVHKQQRLLSPVSDEGNHSVIEDDDNEEDDDLVVMLDEDNGELIEHDEEEAEITRSSIKSDSEDDMQISISGEEEENEPAPKRKSSKKKRRKAKSSRRARRKVSKPDKAIRLATPEKVKIVNRVEDDRKHSPLVNSKLRNANADTSRRVVHSIRSADTIKPDNSRSGNAAFRSETDIEHERKEGLLKEMIPFEVIGNHYTFRVENLIPSGGNAYIFEASKSGSRSREWRYIVKLDYNLRQEIFALTHLHHPNIIELYDFGTIKIIGEEFDYIVMTKYSPVKYDILTASSLANLSMLGHFAKTIISTVKYCHDNLFLLRDIKVDNIVKEDLQDDPEFPFELRLIDFGVAVPFRTDFSGDYIYADTEENITEPCGTVGYMAPEVEDPNALYGPKCDVYSLGIVLAEIAFGRQFHMCDNPTQQLKSAFSNKQNTNRVEKLFEHMVMRMIEVNPDRRPSIDDCLRHDFLRM